MVDARVRNNCYAMFKHIVLVCGCLYGLSVSRYCGQILVLCFSKKKCCSLES